MIRRDAPGPSLMPSEKPQNMSEELVVKAARIAALNHIGPVRKLEIRIENGGISVIATLIVVEQIGNPLEEIRISTALKIDPLAGIGDEIECDVTPPGFGQTVVEECRNLVTSIDARSR